MANYPSALEASLEHQRGQHQPQPNEEETSSSDHAAASLLGAEQDTSSEVRNAPAGSSQLAEPRRGNRLKARVQRGCAGVRRVPEEGGDLLCG